MTEPRAHKAPSREELIREDTRDLHRLGYAQQLYREMGGFSNFAISFSIISILTGAIQLFGYGLQFAGPVINTWGWPLVSVFVLCVAASMAELASAYPTAGGLYFWAHWGLDARHRFRGPQPSSEGELRRLEAELSGA